MGRSREEHQEGGSDAVRLRNDWYRDRYPQVLRVTGLLALVVLVNSALIAYLATKEIEPRYFVADPKTGAVVEIVPVDTPMLSNDALAQWAAETARKAYSIDFVHYDSQLSALRDRFAPQAYDKFLTAIDDSMLKQIKEQRLIFEAIAEQAVITSTSLAANGHFMWQVEVPLNLVVHYGGQQQRQQRLVVQMEVMRVDNRVRPESGVVTTKFVVRG